jgi:adenosylcobinamide kinase/adenosylcobinamide-phosphate guanylyltransferase
LLAETLERHSRPDTLLVVDCLTLWLTNLMLPAAGTGLERTELELQIMKLTQSIDSAPGPIVLVGNEIGLGVIPLGREVRAFVDMLGWLNQSVAAACTRATLMAAGLPLTLKAP